MTVTSTLTVCSPVATGVAALAVRISAIIIGRGVPPGVPSTIVSTSPTVAAGGGRQFGRDRVRVRNRRLPRQGLHRGRLGDAERHATDRERRPARTGGDVDDRPGERHVAHDHRDVVPALVAAVVRPQVRPVRAQIVVGHADAPDGVEHGGRELVGPAQRVLRVRRLHLHADVDGRDVGRGGDGADTDDSDRSLHAGSMTATGRGERATTTVPGSGLTSVSGRRSPWSGRLLHPLFRVVRIRLPPV